MATFLYLLCALVCVLGGGYLFIELQTARNLMDQATVSVIVAAWVIITYCLARSNGELHAMRQRERLLKALAADDPTDEPAQAPGLEDDTKGLLRPRGRDDQP